jgi:hypothetical protein
MKPTAFLTGIAVAMTLSSATQAQVASLSTSTASIMPNRRSVLIEKANLPGQGLIIVRAVRGGSIEPKALGQIQVKPGASSNLRIPLAQSAASGEDYVVMLHADFGKIGVYERTDPLVLSVDIPASVVDGAPH